jgi:hypothetical protein
VTHEQAQQIIELLGTIKWCAMFLTGFLPSSLLIIIVHLGLRRK